jgi:hypothetical protein
VVDLANGGNIIKKVLYCGLAELKLISDILGEDDELTDLPTLILN